MLLLHGKGLWLQRLADCEQGDLNAIAKRARAARLSHLILKVADGADAYNADAGRDQAVELVTRLTDSGIEVWGWQSVYGDRPAFKGLYQDDYHRREAVAAQARAGALRTAGLQGYVIEAHGDYERIPDRARKAAEFMAALRAALPDLPVALSAWKSPAAHPRFPWAEFRRECDLDLPQVFWIGQHGEAARQLEAAVRQFRALTPTRPLAAAGPAFFESNWRPGPDELSEFLARAASLGLVAVNLWLWDQLGLTGDEPASRNPAQLDFRPLWQALADFAWPGAATEWAAADQPARSTGEENRAVVGDERPLEAELAPAEAPMATEGRPGEATAVEALELVENAEVEPQADASPEYIPAWLRAPLEADTATPFPVEALPATAEAGVTLSETVAADEAPTQERTLEEALAAGQLEAEELPEWLRAADAIDLDLSPGTLPDEVAALVGAGDDEGWPAWLGETEAAPLAEEAEPFEALSSSLDEDDLPEWLRAAEAEAALPDEEVETIDALIGGPDEGDLPEWLQARDEAAILPQSPGPLRTIFITPGIAPAPAVPAAVARFFKALRTGRLDDALALYAPGFAHVNAERVAHDLVSVREFYTGLLSGLQAGTLAVQSVAGLPAAPRVHWTAIDLGGARHDVDDEFHINRAGRIAFHHTSLSGGLG